MPIYAYRCASCGHSRDVLQKMSDPVLSVCPVCGADQFQKQVTAAGFQLKGSGWYATDFKGGNAPPAVAAPAAGDAAGAPAPAPAGGGTSAPAGAPAPAPAPSSSDSGGSSGGPSASASSSGSHGGGSCACH
jgi:putative FmdB family regulatory protein